VTLSEVVAVSLVHSFVTNLFCVGVDPNSSDSQSASQVAQGCSGLLRVALWAGAGDLAVVLRHQLGHAGHCSVLKISELCFC